MGQVRKNQNKASSSTSKSQNKPRKIKRQREEDEIKELISDSSSFDLSKHIKLFTDLPISSFTLKGLNASSYENLTPIQALALPRALKGLDVLGAARTGSGKTLAFLIPVLETLYRQKWGHNDALGALIISPTRELAVQIFDVLRAIGRFHSFSAGLVIGGKDLAQERDRLSRMNILVATPGRLQQHLEQTTGFDSNNLQILVLDEADRILDMGFSNCINAIISCLPTSRQTLLFSATQTKSVKDLARLSLKGDPEYVAAREAGVDRDLTTPKELVQSYMITPLESKIDYLWGFVKTHLKTKMIVFMSSCKQVRFVYETFRHLRPGIPLLHLHGKQKQAKRLEIYQKFSSSPQTCLFATDVAARGLDFPSVDWVIQLDCPEDVDTYVHRVGRTARYQSGGKALLFLLPSEEEGMVNLWQERGISVNKVKPNDSKKVSIQKKLQAQMFKFPEVKFLGQRAFISYVRSVYLQRNKQVFDLSKVDLTAFAESLGLPGAPLVRFNGSGSGGMAGGSGESAKAKKNAPRDIEILKKQAIEESFEGPSQKRSVGNVSQEDDDSRSSGTDCDSSDEEESGSDIDAEEEGNEKASGAEKKTVRTKYDRMFQRKNQDILSNHYAKVIERSEDEEDEGTKASDSEDEGFLRIKRVDHELDQDEADIPESEYLSKRKLKMATSKKALGKIATGKKIIFDEQGEAHDAYKIIGEEEFKKSHNVSDEIKDFVSREREKVKEADKRDRLVEKNKKQEKKRKRKGNEDQELENDNQPKAQLGIDSDQDDDGYVSPEFDLPTESDESEPESSSLTNPSSRFKKPRREIHSKDLPKKQKEDLVDLEDMALRALEERNR